MPFCQKSNQSQSARKISSVQICQKETFGAKAVKQPVRVKLISSVKLPSRKRAIVQVQAPGTVEALLLETMPGEINQLKLESHCSISWKMELFT